MLTIDSPNPVAVAVQAPDGSTASLVATATGEGQFSAAFTPQAGPGQYKLEVADSEGQISEAIIAMRQPWSWYMDQARKESLRHGQYASSHHEQWLGLASGILARRHLPDAPLDAQTDQRLQEILELQWDLDIGFPLRPRCLKRRWSLPGCQIR